MQIEQAIYGGQDVGGYRFLARSPGFLEDWLKEAQELCTGFGDRPAGVRCPLAVFARPFGKKMVAVVQVADQGYDDTGRPGALAFRLLILTRDLYRDLTGDPFAVADAFPPPWEQRETLPTLQWTQGPLPGRTVQDVRRILNAPADRTALLLGGAQILVDGGRVVIVRKGPESTLIRHFWALLPTATRCDLWPATFAFGNHHRFHLLVVPEASGPDFAEYAREDKAGDYPEGNYELALQKAAEEEDQDALDSLLLRRSSDQMFRLLFGLLVIVALVSVILRWPGPQVEEKPPAKQENKKPTVAKMHLPARDDVPSLTARQREHVATRLEEIGHRLGIMLPKGNSEPELAQMVAGLNIEIDKRLGDRKPSRDPGALNINEPVQQRLRALLWKHGVEDYAAPGLNVDELLDRVQDVLVKTKLLKETDR